MMNNLICIAKITKPHGIRGQAKLMSYASIPEAIFDYPCLYDEQMNEYKLKLNTQNANMFIVTFNNNKSRNLVEEIAGIKLYITKEMMSETQEDEYYHYDLVGLKIVDVDNNIRGTVLEVHNFGAGDLLEMQVLDEKNTIFLPFEKEFVNEVNISKQFLSFDFAKAGI